MMESVQTILAKLVTLFPNDPFLNVLGDFASPDWLQYLNYFVPVVIISEVTKGWCLAIVLYRIIVYAKRKGSSFFDVLSGGN